MQWDAVIEFPKMKVGVETRDVGGNPQVAGIRYLPLTTASKAPGNALAERAVRQLERYRDDPDEKFDLPLLIEAKHLPGSNQRKRFSRLSFLNFFQKENVCGICWKQ